MQKALFISLLFFLQLTVSGQKLLAPDNYIGIKGGVGAAVFNMDINTDYFYYLESFNGGIVFKTFESRIAALQMELGYTEKGGFALIIASESGAPGTTSIFDVWSSRLPDG